MYNDVNCPYCNHPQDINHDDGYGYDEELIYEQECYNCEKTFTFTTSIMFLYEVEKAPCLNGGDHDYRPVISIPNCFPDRVRCFCCGHEIKGEFDKSVFDDYCDDKEGGDSDGDKE
jgi:hypothetical protein